VNTNTQIKYSQVKLYAEDRIPRQHWAIFEDSALGFILSLIYLPASLIDSKFLFNSIHFIGLDNGFLAPCFDEDILLRIDAGKCLPVHLPFILILFLVSIDLNLPFFAFDILILASFVNLRPNLLPAIRKRLKSGLNVSIQNCSLSIHFFGSTFSIGKKTKLFSLYLFQEFWSFLLPCVFSLRWWRCALKRLSILEIQLPIYISCVKRFVIEYTPDFFISSICFNALLQSTIIKETSRIKKTFQFSFLGFICKKTVFERFSHFGFVSKNKSIALLTSSATDSPVSTDNFFNVSSCLAVKYILVRFIRLIYTIKLFCQPKNTKGCAFLCQMNQAVPCA
jgi:hypothetical protein